jgi:hypothetical protein
MFFFYVMVGLVIFSAAAITFQLNKKLVYQRAVQQLLATSAEWQELKLQISRVRDPVLQQEISRLQKHIVRQGFKNAQPANLTAIKLLDRVQNRINSDKKR